MLTIINVVLVILWLASGAATVAFVLMHSGRGTGVSEALGTSLLGSAAPLGVVEHNLDVATVVSLLIFVACVVVLDFTWPLAPLSALVR